MDLSGLQTKNLGHVLLVSNIPAPYRIPVYAELRKRGVDLEVRHFARTEPGREWAIPMDMYRTVLRTWALPYRESRLYVLAPQRAVAETWCQATLVIGGWESPAAWQLIALARLHRAAVVGFYESTASTHRFSRGPVAAARSRFFRSVDAVLTAGPASTQAVLALGVPAERIVTGFNSVDVDAFAEGAASVRARSRSGPGHRFLYVGQLIARKNLASALQAFATIARPQDTFTIVGTGPLLAELEQLAADLTIGDQVGFVGHKEGDGLHEAYGNANTFVLPSRKEVWGLVVNEALASGLHAVVSDRAGIVPSVQHMRGVFTAETTPNGLARQMAASRDAWQGPVAEPEMLQHKPENAADAVTTAIEVGRRRARQRRAA